MYPSSPNPSPKPEIGNKRLRRNKNLNSENLKIPIKAVPAHSYRGRGIQTKIPKKTVRVSHRNRNHRISEIEAAAITSISSERKRDRFLPANKFSSPLKNQPLSLVSHLLRSMSSPPSIRKAAEDIISSLPDSVLSHILSFLPTKLAVATSILSKRWTTLWLLVPTLDVDEENFKSFKSFRRFVDSVIASRHPKLSLESLHIRCGKSRQFKPRVINRWVQFKPRVINRWVQFKPRVINRLVLVAVQRGLQNLDLDLNMCLYWNQIYDPIILQVLSCKTLVVLKLKNLWVLDVPHLVHLPLLKTLYLENISFLDEYAHLMNLLNGCPILEDLHVDGLELDHDCHVSKEEFKGFPHLVRANICDCELVFPYVWLYNAEFMRVTVGDVKQMSINEYPVPTFHNLTHMELIFDFDWSEMWVIQVLQHCPKLQNLIFVQADDIEAYGLEDWKDPETVPECLSSQLRTCLLKGFKGNQCELHFAEYVMLNSKILRTMTIESNLVDEKAKYQMQKKLSSYPRGSVTCKLFFD